MQLLDASVGHPRCWLTAVLSDFQWARTKLPAWRFDGLPPDADIGEIFGWILPRTNAWRASLRHLWRCVSGRAAQSNLPPDAIPGPPTHKCRLCGFTCDSRHSLASHLALRHRLTAKVQFFTRGSFCQGCSLNFHTRTRLLKHLTKSSPSCRRFLFTHGRHHSLAVQCKLAEDERIRLRSSKGRGRLDKLPAVPGTAVTDLGDDDSNDELLFYLDDFL